MLVQNKNNFILSTTYGIFLLSAPRPLKKIFLGSAWIFFIFQNLNSREKTQKNVWSKFI